jgi:hypothetical protein
LIVCVVFYKYYYFSTLRSKIIYFFVSLMVPYILVYFLYVVEMSKALKNSRFPF